jgi:Mrp family chromosome partitioning ATPase
MGEVDEALRHAFAQRAASSQRAAVPPGPHGPPSGTDAKPGRAAAVSRFDSITAQVDPTPPSLVSFDSGPCDDLLWPEIVQVLEREWGERFEQLADRLIEARRRQALKVLLFTSCHRAEGRTTLVLTLSRALARRPGRTVVVDADLCGPMLSRLLGIRPEVGLEDVVEHGFALSEALIEAPDDHLWVLPLRAAVARPRDFLASPGWSCAMARLRREFDFVLIDGSPMFTGLSAAVLHRSVDAAVLVHHHGITSERSLLRAREVLEAGGIPLLGLAETFS